MFSPRRSRAAKAGIAAGLASALILAGCGLEDEPEAGDQGGSSAEPSISLPPDKVTVDPKLAAKVPEEVKKDGKITVGTDPSYAPSEFLDEDGKTVKGFNVDLFNAAAKRLGLEVEWEPAQFKAILPGIESGKYEVGVSSFTINPERLKQVTMISYFNAGTQWASASGNPKKVDPDDACGLNVAVQAGTVQVDDIEARSKKCTDAGDDKITINQFERQDQATASVVSGKNDAMLADSPVVAYAVQQTGGKLAELGQIYDAAPYGIVVKKESTEFAEAIQGAYLAIMSSGEYRNILMQWNVNSGRISAPEINPKP